MSKLGFVPSNIQRGVADAADLLLRNRYFEKNPALSEEGENSLIARPGLKYWHTVGDGPVRGLFSEAGAFGGDLFVASGDSMYRVKKDKTSTLIQSGLFAPDKGIVKMVVVAPIGAQPERLFFTDGRNLFVYTSGNTCSVVTIPNDDGCVDLAVIASFVIVLPVQDAGTRGKFYWIKPGAIVITDLDFATAESSPDALLGVSVIGDNFVLTGESSTEVWYVDGDATFPMKRLKGVVFDRGTWEQTSVAINEALVLVDAQGGVFVIQGGQPQRVSTHDIEEAIRKSIQNQQRFDAIAIS